MKASTPQQTTNMIKQQVNPRFGVQQPSTNQRKGERRKRKRKIGEWSV
jgi:hypothetical protein